jgi:hypothetical protein
VQRPATLQGIIEPIFEKERYKFVIPYLDNIIIFSKDTEKHGKHIGIVLEKLKDAELSLNKNKCKFFRT